MKRVRIKKEREWVFRLKHDSGVTVMKVSATSAKAAKQKIMEAEGCPESAIS